jgi:transcriptional regulator with GAF, ATPase, and Fis domain
MINILNHALIKDLEDVEKVDDLEHRLIKEKPSLNMNLKKLAGINDISAARGNLYALKDSMINLFLNNKRFNGENKTTNLANFHAELKYTVELVINTRGIFDLIFRLLQIRNPEDLDREIRLYFHTYFHCEFTMILTVSFPNTIDEKTMIKGNTSHSQTFEVPLTKLGPHIQSVIEKKHYVQVDAKKDTHKVHDLTKVVPGIINKPIFNYVAYPVLIDNVCTHIVVLCNRRKD